MQLALDMWMVRTTLTRAHASGHAGGAIERYTAVDLDPDDATPGVYPLLLERGTISQAADGAWTNRRTEVRAWNDADARDAASAVYDAARGFLALGITPGADLPAVATPDQLRIEVGDLAWSFPIDAAPAAAWAVLAAAQASMS